MKLFGFLHFVVMLFAVVFFYFGKKVKNTEKALFISSVALFVMEIAKQAYLISVGYNWGYFPYQLCSVPLYLWFLWPIRKTKYFSYKKVFLMCYMMIGAIFGLLLPLNSIKMPVLLMIHSFLWHYILVFISSVCISDKKRDLSLRGFGFGTLIFYLHVAIATVLNLCFTKFGKINMFYMNPLPREGNPDGANTLPIVKYVAKELGIKGHFLYSISIVLAAFIVFQTVRLCTGYRSKKVDTVVNR